MKIWIMIGALLLWEPKVQCDQRLLCSQREPPAGVLVLRAGSEVALGCRGEVTVDGVPRRMSQKIEESPSAREKPSGGATSPPDVGTPNPGVVATSERSEGAGRDKPEETEDGARATRSVGRRVQWTRNGRPVRGGAEEGGRLRFPSVRVSDSGNYSCHGGDGPVWTVRLAVGVAPESPSLRCYKRSHVSKIRCEWNSGRPIIPRPQCSLLLSKGMEIFRANCSYSPERSRCWCAFPCDEGEHDTYSARLCVSNAIGSALSPNLLFTPPDILKPDCPSQVTAWPVEGAPHTLRVTWHLPRTWKQSRFYRLEFCLRYCPTQAKEFQEVPVGRGQFYVISDALVNTEYKIQLKAKDDLDGVWSDWTHPVYGRPWTAPVPTPFDMFGSLEPSYGEGSGGSEEDPEAGWRPEANGGRRANEALVVGLCLSVSVAVVAAVAAHAFRHRLPSVFKKWVPASRPLPSAACQAEVHLQQRSPHHSECRANQEGEGIHLHNVDYFFSPRRRDSTDS